MTITRADTPFARGADYWLRHARRHIEAGNEKRALPMLRHALRLTPDDTDARMLYAEVLSDLECCEASNREAFAALARDPRRFECYGVIADNFTRLGLEQPARAAYARYISGVSPWDCLYVLEGRFSEQKRRQNRLDGLLDMAYRRLMSNDVEGARRALIRSSNPPYFETNVDRELLLSLHQLMCNHRKEAASIAECALALMPRSTHVLCMVATILAEAGVGDPDRPRKLLLRAMLCARSSLDELEAVDAMVAFGAFGMCACLLSARLRKHSTRISTMFNLAIVCLRLGNLTLGLRYAHRCRDIDPEDVYAESLWSFTEDWKRRGLYGARVREAAERLPLYGRLLPDEAERMSRRIVTSVKRSMRAFAREIEGDELLRRRYIAMLTLRGGVLVQKLPKVIEGMTDAGAAILLREALAGEPSAQVAAFASGWLIAHGMARDVAMLKGGRLAVGELKPEGRGRATFMQRALARRINRAGYFVRWPGFNMAALRTLRRMTARQRYLLAGDSDGRWTFAFAMVVARQYGLKPPILEPFRLVTPERIAALIDHAHRLRPEGGAPMPPFRCDWKGLIDDGEDHRL